MLGKEKRGWNVMEPEGEIVSKKKISHSSDNISDNLAEEMRTETMIGS